MSGISELQARLLRDATAQGSTAAASFDANPDLEHLRTVPAFRTLVAPRD